MVLPPDLGLPCLHMSYTYLTCAHMSTTSAHTSASIHTCPMPTHTFPTPVPHLSYTCLMPAPWQFAPAPTGLYLPTCLTPAHTCLSLLLGE